MGGEVQAGGVLRNIPADAVSFETPGDPKKAAKSASENPDSISAEHAKYGRIVLRQLRSDIAGYRKLSRSNF